MNPVTPNTAAPQVPVKKPKLTKAQKKAIAAQKLIELKQTMMRDFLKRELQFTAKSYERGYDGWAQMLKDIKRKSLVEELGDWKLQVDRLIDRKNYRVNFLLQTLNVAEEQHQRNFSGHCKIINFLLLLCDQILKSLKHVYESNCIDIIDEFHIECTNRTEYQNNIQNYYENLLHAIGSVTENQTKQYDEKILHKREDVINTNIVKQYTIRDNTVKKINDLRIKLDNVLIELKKDSGNARPQEEYDSLMVKQKNFEEDFVKQLKLVESGYEKVFDLQTKLTKLETDTNFRISNLQMERNYFVEVYWNLKVKVKKINKNYEKDIQELAMECFQVIKHFEKWFKFGELLLSLSTSCRKLQTEKEKVSPFEISIYIPKHQSADNTTKNLDFMQLLQNFTQRASRVETHILLLQNDKKQLLKENECYCNIIRNLYGTIELDKIMREIKVSENLSIMKEDGKFF